MIVNDAMLNWLLKWMPIVGHTSARIATTIKAWLAATAGGAPVEMLGQLN